MDSVTMRPGTSFTRNVTVYTDSTHSDLENLTETVTVDIRDAPNGEVLFNGAYVIDAPETGEITISLAPDDTEDMIDTTHVLYGEVWYGDYIVDSFKLVVQ